MPVPESHHLAASKAKATLNTDQTPKSWPDSVLYINRPLYSPSVSESTIATLNKPTKPTAHWPKISHASHQTPHQAVQIVPIASAAHPANGQHGLFATKTLAPATFILPYLGLVHTDSDTDTDAASDYDLSLDRDLGLAVDATITGNEARFMNDYRGVAEGPNAEFADCWVQVPRGGDGAQGGTMGWERRIGIFVLGAGKKGKRRGGIRAGEEVLVNYGRSFWRERGGIDGNVEEVAVVCDNSL